MEIRQKLGGKFFRETNMKFVFGGDWTCDATNAYLLPYQGTIYSWLNLANGSFDYVTGRVKFELVHVSV